jgi:hypothetical protein
VTSGGSSRTGWSSHASQSRTGFFRAHPRFEARLRVLVTHVHAGWQRHAPVENIGLGGARLLVDERLAAGDVVTLSFTAPTLWDPLVLRARIAWVAPGDPPYRAGVAFEHKSAEAVLGLQDLIATMAYE